MSAEIINLNDSLPAAPTGYTNGKWQKGPQSGIDPGTGLGVFPVSVYVPVGAGLVHVQEVPAGVGTSTLTLSFPPIAATLIYTINGVEQIPTVDYTLSSLTISMTVSTESDDYVVATYAY